MADAATEANAANAAAAADNTVADADGGRGGGNDNAAPIAAADYDQMLSWMWNRAEESGLPTDDQMDGPTKEAVVEFLTRAASRSLVLVLSNGIISATLDGLPASLTAASRGVYFLKTQAEVATPSTISSLVQFGTFSGNAVGSLERLLTGVFASHMSSAQSWPEGVRKEIKGHYHRFMAMFTETTNHAQGKTVLYLPAENVSTPADAARDKDVVQQMESIVIHWTRQVKDVVNNHENAASSEDRGPLDEIEFWRSRTVDLSGIRDQLQAEGVGRVMTVLEHAKSSYLAPFQTLTQEIEHGCAEARDNLRFLESITAPCQQLAEAEPASIPDILPTLLHCIRMIWSLSTYYNTDELITGLLRKISNEIIRRCRARIDTNEIFTGDVGSCLGWLQESIDCGVTWRRIYRRTAKAIRHHRDEHGGRYWDFDDAAIFAQVDAFVQRCRDLMEVCEAQIQFARKSIGSKSEAGPLPQFGGTRAGEIVKALLGVQTSFQTHVNALHNLDYDLLDVRTSRWHDDYNVFKNAVKDLEVMYINVITTAFESVSTVADAVALLEIFYSLAKREAIRRTVEKKTSEVYAMFSRQVTSIRAEFDVHRTAPPLRANEPQYAGSALWADALLNMATANWDLLQQNTFLVKTREAEEAHMAFTSLHNVLTDFKWNRYQLWINLLSSIDNDGGLPSRLEKPLFRRMNASDMSRAQGVVKPGHIACNFDADLLALFAEVQYWEKLQGQFSIPYGAHDMCNQKEKLRLMREQALSAVRAYNAILSDLEPDERRLFNDHLRRLDRRVNQGLSKINWTAKGMIELYIRDVVTHCGEVHALVLEFKRGKEVIHRTCRQISNALLVKIDKNVAYDDGLFEAKQREHRQQNREKLRQALDLIVQVMTDMFVHFKEGSPEVLREWRSQVNNTDKLLEQSLRQTVKRSLQELSRAINGDARTEPITLFTVRIVLAGSRVDYRPSMISLTHTVNIVAKELIGTISAVPRVKEQSFATVPDAPEGDTAGGGATGNGAGAAGASSSGGDGVVLLDDLEEKQEALPTYYKMISNDEDMLEIVVQILNGMTSTATELQKYLSYWDKYKSLWEMDKESYIRKYAKANRPPSMFDQDVVRYRELQSDIQGETISHTINFVRVDTTELKSNLVGHCLQTQSKLTSLLNQNGQKELKGLHELFQSNTALLTRAPTTLDELSNSIKTSRSLRENLPEIQGRFAPVREIYETLGKFEVSVTDNENQMLDELDDAFIAFGEMLDTVDKMLDKSKVNMKRDLESQLDGYGKHVEELRGESKTALPYNADKAGTVEEALELIEEYRARTRAARDREVALKPGLDIFGIDTPDHEDLRATERELDLLEQIWTLTSEWETSWSDWKQGQFRQLDVEDMETAAAMLNKRIVKLGRDIKKWGVWEAMRAKIDKFRATLPLIQDLKNPALRPRHWTALIAEVGRDFDASSSDFTLERVWELGLDKYSDLIGELSSNANKELAIEQALEALEHSWAEIVIDIGRYKDTYYKVRSTDDLFQSLEDDSVNLSTMKASKFYGSFQEKIDYWESTLSLISEVVELLLGVQRKWIYLESIFMSGGDISKHLPREYALFCGVNQTFISVTETMYMDPNAQRACKREGILDEITEMDNKLDEIQRSLDDYLEKKRMAFPRFYFVSDDDLLEILGQARDPVAVQKHVKKCFEGVKTLEIIEPGANFNRTHEAKSMNSPDGENAPFADNVVLDGPVELWLGDIEAAMQRGMSKLLMGCIQGNKGKKERWVKDWQGQLLITTGAIVWTASCVKALQQIAGGSKNAMKQLKKKQVSFLNKLTAMVRGQLTKVERKKVVALITMEIHNRDVMERIIKANCASTQDFEWLSQLRFEFHRDDGEFGACVVKQTNSLLQYSYEYQGNNGRLVVTPLTDRCVLTLTTAMYLNRGGNPLGPAGTGKTETVKDLGKNLAKYVVVINCSDGMDYKSVGRIFSGLVQSGSWGCFDEFNRIKIEVISVVAMQILSIITALSTKVEAFTFMGQEIPCNPNCGIFITMNPGYAGRTELPDNLKALMRPVAMMVPDMAMIAEVMLAAEGFTEARILAKKTITLYNLMVQQLSKQDHYDYGLRSLKAVLTMAGALKREDPERNEETILLRALRDMNLPKLIQDDESLFRLLLGDLFPSLELPVPEHGELFQAIEEQLDIAKLQRHPFLLGKIMQVFDSMATRHCNMLVGGTMSGKSVAWSTLQKAKTALAQRATAAGAPLSFESEYIPVSALVLNPKSVTLNELYGAYDLQTFEWTDGIISTMFKNCAESEKVEEKWIMFDGPVDTLWIESMNSVMDDNKILTLINGDRIPMTNAMSLLFEVEDLAVASPATVSRAGMVYVDASEMGWQPFVESWLARQFGDDQEARDFHRTLFFDKYVARILKFKRSRCSEPVPVADFPAVQSLCSMYEALATPENGLNREDGSSYFALAEKWFVFCIVWTVLGALDEVGRQRVDVALRDIDAVFPPNNTIYDFFLDPSRKDFELWSTKVPAWRAQKHMGFHDMVVPTTDTVRNFFVLNTFVQHQKNILLVGNTGTGKTILAQTMLQQLPETHSQLVLNFSAATTAGNVQDIVEGVMEKRSKDKLGPTGGKQLVVFVDDFNMPRKTSAESPYQPALELLRMWIDYGGWYDRAKCSWKHVVDSQLVAAMAPPGGGRAEISSRTQSRFAMLNLTFPHDSQVIRIFEALLLTELGNHDAEIKSLAGPLANATLQVYKAVCTTFLPTPEKFHYLFNLREVARVVQGMLQMGQSNVVARDSLLRLWVHECQRVFQDRLLRDAADDERRMRDILIDKMKEVLETDYGQVMAEACEGNQGQACFTGVLREPTDDGRIYYDEATSFPQLKALMEEKLENYNLEPKLLSMDLVLFRDAVLHVCRIHRVLLQARGNAMLVGVGGSGRQSLARLATYIAGYELVTVEITKNYRIGEFHEDLKRLYNIAGVEGRATTFLFSDTQIKEPAFLEDLNNILSSGEVPGLFQPEDIQPIYDAMRKPCQVAGLDEVPENLWRLFISRVRANLHIVLAMSPVGDHLRNRCRMYPGLVNCTTIDWFHTWPADALEEVAIKFLGELEIEKDSIRQAIARVFASMHISVIDASETMRLQLKRHNYVTPTNYLELVKGYIVLSREKSKELGDAANKLANGLTKLEEARVQVEEMSAELEDKKVIVAQSQKSCEDLLVEIVSERRVADEQRRQVEADSERIAKEEEECKAIAADAEADLNVALPALERAMTEVDKLDKSAISEVKAYTTPPKPVQTVLSAVMILLGRALDWATAKKTLGEANFLQQVKTYDKDNVSNSILNKIKKYVDQRDFTAEEVKKVSVAAAALCTWVHAIFVYANVVREVAPKRARLRAAMDSLATKQAALKAAQDALAEATDKVNKLKQRYDDSVAEKNRLRDEAEELERKLDRANKLVTGLAGEYVRWQASIESFNAAIHSVVGDALVAAAFLSYAGPFDTVYRADLVSSWLKSVQQGQIPIMEQFSFATFLARATDVRDWNIQGLPRDGFSTENGVIVTRGSRWPLMIDPQGQANRWIRNLEGNVLRVIDLKQKDFLRTVENAIQYGMPVLLQDVGEELDPSLEPVLSKSIIKIGTREVIRLGDKELDYSRDFRLYITTKMANPHYTPEVSTKTTVVNFSVKEEGLEAQLLGFVVQKEEPALEEQKSELTIRVAAGKRKLADLEDEILRLLSESTGSLLDDEELVTALGTSKVTSEEVTQQLVVAEETEKKIDAAREGYRSAATRASLAFFVLNDMGRVDPMYQFSLDAYVELYSSSIAESRRPSGDDGSAISVAERCNDINSFHTLSVYRYVCRGLFERHKLLFSLQLCIKIMQKENKVPQAEFDFLCYGGVVVDRSLQRDNPNDSWISEAAWDNITELDKISGFSGFASSFEQSGNREWRMWYLSARPEETPLPGEWDNKCSELQHMCILRALRVDRILFAATRFISNNLGPEYADPPPFDLRSVYETSTCRTPLIFVLSPGVDPTAQVQWLGGDLGVKVEVCALGQGQSPTAVRLINEGLRDGNWVFLANCHLLLSWMAELEKIVTAYATEGSPHPAFRLWLSSSPDPNFPIVLLQRGIKMTTEPPRGLRANLAQLYNIVSEEQFSRSSRPQKYKRLLFALSWFHATLLERRKFKSMGFNIPYDFNESDFSICHDLVIVFLDEYDETPFDAMKYLVAQANYGGRVTDDWDRRLVNVYMDQFFCPEAIDVDGFLLSDRPEYRIPPDGDLQSYKDFIRQLPISDHPAAFGQHPNADVSSAIDDANILIGTLVSLQPKLVAGTGESNEDKLTRQAEGLLEQVPENFDAEQVRTVMASRSDPDPLKTVLYQEVDRYNKLLKSVKGTLRGVLKAVQGLVVVTAELEDVMACLLEFRVPASWGKCFPSIKPLGSWMRELVQRCQQITDWVEMELPRCFWLPGFTYPTGFLTALLQTTARKNGVAIDSLSWEFPVLDHADLSQITAPAKDGAYVSGLVLEGARWSFEQGHLDDPSPMELTAPMPIVHFKPAEKTKKAQKGMYVCPLYMYPVRTGTRERPSFVCTVDVRCGDHTPEFWCKRGTAILLTTAN